MIEVPDYIYRTVQKLAADSNLPDFLKEATAESLAGEGAKANSCLRPGDYGFPCHTKSACFVSLHAYWDERPKLAAADAAKADASADRFARYWSLENEWSKIKSSAVKAAAVEHAYALPDSVTGNGDHLQITSPEDLGASAGWLLQNRDSLEFGLRTKAAAAILERGAELGIDLPEDVRKLAGYGIPDLKEMHREIYSRKTSAIRRGLGKEAAELQQVAEALVFAPNVFASSENLLAACEALSESDRVTGYANNYKEGSLRPEDFLFAVGVDEATKLAETAVRTATGSVYSQSDLGGLQPSDLAAQFGQDFADAVSNPLGLDLAKFAEEAAILPLPDAEILDSMLRDRGITPSAKRADSVPMLTEAELLAMA